MLLFISNFSGLSNTFHLLSVIVFFYFNNTKCIINANQGMYGFSHHTYPDILYVSLLTQLLNHIFHQIFRLLIRKIINLHCMADILHSFGSCFSRFLAALFQDLIYLRYPLLPGLSALSDRCQFSLYYIVQEFLHLYISKPASLIMSFQLIQTAVFWQKFLEMLRSAECIQIDKYWISLNLTRILHQ